MDDSAFIAWIRHISDRMTEHRALLDELDNRIGDGDHGSNMDRGFRNAVQKLEADAHTTPGELSRTVAMALIGSVGGASGPLYGSAFLKLATAWGTALVLGDSAVRDGLRAALDAIRARGKAEAGDKTMVDVWQRAVFCLQDGGASVDFVAVAEAAQKAALATATMEARKGRAAYLGPRSKGTCDPGSVSSAIMFEELADVIQGKVGRWPWHTLQS